MLAYSGGLFSFRPSLGHQETVAPQCRCRYCRGAKGYFMDGIEENVIRRDKENSRELYDKKWCQPVELDRIHHLSGATTSLG